jgi:neopullulanase
MFFTAFLFVAFGISAALNITKMEPAFWWSGMKNPELQIMVYGTEISNARVTVLSSDVILKSVVKCDSPNYLFIYLDLTKAMPGQIKLQFQEGKKKKVVFYELKNRTFDPASRKGFSTSDVLYLLMPDRFANGNPANDNIPMKYCTVNVDRKDPNSRHGGDIEGIIQHLDYIADLGVTAIWLNPVLENDMPGGSYHGYATTDYYKVDPRFGTNEDYVRLIESSHRKGLKVVMDMIFNHCGSEHIWKKDMPFKDWFNFNGEFVQTNHDKFVSFDPYVSEYDKKMMFDGWFVKEMPDLNQRNPHLAKYLIQNSIWWVEFSGIDGIRQDTHPYADAEMMSEWCKELLTEYPDFNIVGETWVNYQPGIAYWQAGSKLNEKGNSNLKTVMDFPLMLESHDAFHKNTDWDNGLTRIYELLCFDYMYPDINNLLVFLENHDTNRFLLEFPADLSVFKQAYAFLLTSRGIPQLYYGLEILMNGNKKISDGNVRLDFPGGWPGDVINAFTAEGRNTLQNEAHDYIKKLLDWRKGNDIIAKGTLRHFVPRNGAYVYTRSYKGKKVLVILNGVDKENVISLNQYREALDGIMKGKDVITEKIISLVGELTLSPRESLILEL